MMTAHLIAEEGPQRGLVLRLEPNPALEAQEWIVGRNPEEADFVLEDSTVSRKHARLIQTREGVYIQNLSRTNPILVNGDEAPERRLLLEGDKVQIGHSLFRFSEEEAPPLPEPAEPRYDTVYEGGAEEALPLSLTRTQTPYVLKVAAGPNTGAEIGLDRGKVYLIGKDPNVCDIAFNDLSVSRTHARLTVTEEGAVEIEDLGSKNRTAVNGIPIEGKRSLSSSDMVALGTTVFFVVDREAPLETIYSPPMGAGLTPATAAAGGPSTPQRESIEWKKEKIPTKYLVLAASFLTVSLIVFISFFSLFKAAPLEHKGKEPLSELTEALARFPSVRHSFNPGSGKLFLVGHVLTAVNYAELQYAIGQVPFVTDVENAVVIDELVWKNMNDVLSGNSDWRGVSITSSGPGQFVAQGLVQTNAQLDDLSDYLTVNFPYVDKLQNRVVSVETLTVEIQSTLAVNGFGGVQFQIVGGQLVLTGRYSDKMEREYEKLVKHLKGLSGINGVKNYAIASHPDLAGIDISQQYQVSGLSLREGKGFSVVLNGRIYEKGGLVDGMRITSIGDRAILLEKDGVKYTIANTVSR
jgi:type III secretion system YscD/HrpQ family protein